MKCGVLRVLGKIITFAALALLARSALGEDADYAKLQQGRYLVTAGDCAACHTAEGGAMLAGGRPIDTPFGVIFAPNITPDPETGIGSWTDDQFYHAMHDGIAADGSHLYPAFPYPWFTKATRQDVDAIRAYLRTIPSAKYRRPNNTLPWPLDNRTAMVGWNELYFKAGTFLPDAHKSKEWNRGAYLVEGLAHCGACHSPKNVFGAVEDSKGYQGSEIQHWFAPSLTGDTRTGLGNWTQTEIVQFLKTGQIDRTVAYGPMAEVVKRSTSAMNDDDLTAIAIYLKGLPSDANNEPPSRPAQGVVEAGRAIYADACSACHHQNGEGVSGLFPALKGSAVVQSSNPTTVLRLILDGGHAGSTATEPTAPSMPAFDWKLSDQQIAAVASFVRSAWGNAAAPVSGGDVSELRKSLQSVSSSR